MEGRKAGPSAVRYQDYVKLPGKEEQVNFGPALVLRDLDESLLISESISSA